MPSTENGYLNSNIMLRLQCPFNLRKSKKLQDARPNGLEATKTRYTKYGYDATVVKVGDISIFVNFLSQFWLVAT